MAKWMPVEAPDDTIMSGLQTANLLVSINQPKEDRSFRSTTGK
jgi:hypothetical protein